jgi:hypothetical protein
VTHRVAGLAGSDRVLTVDGGRLTEGGRLAERGLAVPAVATVPAVLA